MATTTIRIKKTCEWCKKEFIAQKVSTRYCSPSCSSKACKNAKRMQLVKEMEDRDRLRAEEDIIKPIEGKSFLTPKECATLLNVTISTVYKMIYAGKLKAAKISSRMTRINRDSVDAMMESKPYVKRVRGESAPINEFYTNAEIIEKFGVSNSWVFLFGKEHNIPKTIHRGKTLWSAKHFDAYFAKKKPDPDITEWYTTEEIRAKFEMSTSAIYNFVSRNGIPSKKEKGKTYYSKTHFDKAKGVSEDFEPEYYTMAEAMKKYNMTRDQIYKYVTYHHVTKYKKGRYTYILRKGLDALLAPPTL